MSKDVKIIIGLDGEFSGYFHPDWHYMLAFGACAKFLLPPGLVPMSLIRRIAATEGKFSVSMHPPTPDHEFESECKEAFWDVNVPLLNKFTSEAIPVEEAMKKFIHWVETLAEGMEASVIFVVDCPTDATWFNYYLTKFGDHLPLDRFFGPFTSQPYISDDASRGVLRTFDDWGLDERLREKFQAKMKTANTHDPAEDAENIVAHYLLAMTGENFFKSEN